jgi:uncharacterized protein (DUF983 family)
MRGLRLRCPLCGRGKLFRGLFRMHETCSNCGIKYEREAGFFLGSIYINYGLTALVVAVAYPILLFNKVVAERALLLSALAFVLVFPLVFFRFARSLWLAFDQYWDPRPVRLSDNNLHSDP